MRERILHSENRPTENRKAAPIVAAISVVAALTLWLAVATSEPSADWSPLGLVLVALGLLAEVLAYREEKRKSSVAAANIVPYAAALLCAPDWRIVVAIAAGQVFVQLWHRRSAVKAIFNVAQLSLAMSGALLIQRALTRSDFSIEGSSFASAILSLILPAAGSVVTQTVINTVCMALIISAVADGEFRQHVKMSLRHAGTPAALQTVFVTYLAWLSVNLGWVGALGMALPILALRQLTKTAIDLTNVTEELLDLMVAAIEARDPYTSGHSKRVAQTSVTIATALGLKDAEVERVQVAALLHDVGKIHEEFARILSKEGRLTPEEWDIMKRHPVRSSELVSLVTTLKDVVPAVRHHHENWDGTGYPAGIKAEAIPLASRIIMFADTLDAITTDRPYRKALDPEEARREFLKFRGKQFDPSICDVVVSEEVWPRLYAAAKQAKVAPLTSSFQKVTVVA